MWSRPGRFKTPRAVLADRISFIDDLAEEGAVFFARPDQVIHLQHNDLTIRELSGTVTVSLLGMVMRAYRGIDTEYIYADVKHSDYDPRVSLPLSLRAV